VEAEIPLFQRALWIRGAAWDFGREGPLGEELSPHLRFSGRWFFHPNFYLLGGWTTPGAGLAVPGSRRPLDGREPEVAAAGGADP
jgi:hypothetical protein